MAVSAGLGRKVGIHWAGWLAPEPIGTRTWHGTRRQSQYGRVDRRAMPNSMPKCRTRCSVTSTNCRRRHLADKPFEKAKFEMRTYNGCRFSSFLSLGIALNCADTGRLIDLSSAFSQRSVIFLGDRARSAPGSGRQRSLDWSLRRHGESTAAGAAVVRDRSRTPNRHSRY